MMTLPTRDELVKLLQDNSSVQVKFTKKSTGETRVMLCTLNRFILAQAGAYSSESPKTERKTPDHLVHAYDVEAGGWRSFDIATVTEVNVC